MMAKKSVKSKRVSKSAPKKKVLGKWFWITLAIIVLVILGLWIFS